MIITLFCAQKFLYIDCSAHASSNIIINLIDQMPKENADTSDVPTPERRCVPRHAESDTPGTPDIGRT